MSTHAMIGTRSDGKLLATYVHMDGGFDNLGRTLDLHYNTNAAVRTDIVESGRFSALGPTYVLSQPKDDDRYPLVFGEVGFNAGTPDSEMFFLNAFAHASDIEYAYFWDGANWLTRTADDDRISYVRERFTQTDEEFMRHNHEQEPRWTESARRAPSEELREACLRFAAIHRANAGAMWKRIRERSA